MTFYVPKRWRCPPGTLESKPHDIENGSLCVSGSPDGMDSGSRFGGAWDAMDDNDDLVVLEGRIIREIYDGYVIAPEREVARFTVGQWRKMLASGEAYEFEG